MKRGADRVLPLGTCTGRVRRTEQNHSFLEVATMAPVSPISPDSIASAEDEGASADTEVEHVPYLESTVPMGLPGDHILNQIGERNVCTFVPEGAKYRFYVY